MGNHGKNRDNGSFRRDDRPPARRGKDRDRPLRRRAFAALERRCARRPVLPRLPQQPLPLHRREGRAGGADRARRGRRRASLRAPPRRVRARLDARAHPAARRPRRAPGGKVEPRTARASHPLDRRLHRPGLGRARDARTLERRQPADHDLSRHEDRADLLHADDGAGRDAVRLGLDRLEIQGPARTDREPLLAELRGLVTVLVTGGTGVVGPYVVHTLRTRDAPVRALVRDASRGTRLANWGAELAVGDVTDPASLLAACEGVDSVVHLVAIIKGRREDFERVMAEGTRNVVVAAQAAGVRRFVLASALGLDERTKDAVPYFAAKWEMERAVRESGLEHVIFRPSFVFGRDGGVLPTFVRLARFAPVTPIVGPGTLRLQPIWVEDVAEYYARAVDLPAAAGRTFEIGGPDAPTWNEFWNRLKRVLGARRPSLHVPFGLMRVQATLTERLPGAPVTRDQLTMLALGDNVVSTNDAVETFAIPLVALDEQLRRAAS